LVLSARQKRVFVQTKKKLHKQRKATQHGKSKPNKIRTGSKMQKPLVGGKKKKSGGGKQLEAQKPKNKKKQKKGDRGNSWCATLL